jgi:tellurite resistance-related uncharacterized protein
MNIEGKVWGTTIKLYEGNNVEFHKIHAVKGGYCSMHCHQSKYNKFIVEKGALKITEMRNRENMLEDITILKLGDEHVVQPGVYHMFEALEDTDAYEVYYVELDTNDIHRLNQGGRRE